MHLSVGILEPTAADSSSLSPGPPWNSCTLPLHSFKLEAQRCYYANMLKRKRNLCYNMCASKSRVKWGRGGGGETGEMNGEKNLYLVKP